MKKAFTVWGTALIISALLFTSCSLWEKKRNVIIGGEEQCGITPELKKAVEGYRDVFQVRNGLIVVGAKTMMKDETGRDFYPQGCIDINGNVVIPINFHGALISDEVVSVLKYTIQGSRFGLLDFHGNEILPCEYEEIFISDFISKKNIRVKKNGLYGLVDKKGKVLIPIQYERLNTFYVDEAYRQYEEGDFPDVYIAIRKGKQEVINLTPEVIPSTPFDVNLIGDYGNQKFVDFRGNLVAGPFQNVRISGDHKIPLFPEGVAAVVKNNKVGFIDMHGNVRIPFDFYYNEFDFNIHSSSFGIFSEGLATMMTKDNKWGYIDKNGKTVIPFMYGAADCFHRGSSIVGKLVGGQARYGMINKNNTLLLPFEFDSGVFTGNVFAMCQNGKWGVYSPSGTCLAPCQYEQQISYFAGYATVMLNGKQGLIDENGQLLISCEYDICMYQEWCNMVWVRKNGKVGCLNMQNEVVVPLEFDDVFGFTVGNHTLFIVRKDGRSGLYDLCGNCSLD